MRNSLNRTEVTGLVLLAVLIVGITLTAVLLSNRGADAAAPRPTVVAVEPETADNAGEEADKETQKGENAKEKGKKENSRKKKSAAKDKQKKETEVRQDPFKDTIPTSF